MLETVKIRRAGFPVRRTFRDFYSRSVYQTVCYFCCCVPENLCVYMFVHFCRYKIILKNKIHSDDEKQCCSDLLTLQDKDKQEWHLGKTKVQRACKVSHMHTCPNMFVSLVLDLHSCHRNHKCYADLTSSTSHYSKAKRWQPETFGAHCGYWFCMSEFVCVLA